MYWFVCLPRGNCMNAGILQFPTQPFAEQSCIVSFAPSSRPRLQPSSKTLLGISKLIFKSSWLLDSFFFRHETMTCGISGDQSAWSLGCVCGVHTTDRISHRHCLELHELWCPSKASYGTLPQWPRRQGHSQPRGWTHVAHQACR